MTAIRPLKVFYAKESFYSQRVLLALHELGLPYESRLVNLMLGEQFQPCFLEYNPKCEIPVLQDDARVVTESSLIVDYLDQNHNDALTRGLTADQKSKVGYFCHLIDPFPSSILTFGSLLHPEFVKDSTVDEQERKGRLNRIDKLTRFLDDALLRNPDYHEELQAKKARLEARMAIAKNRAMFVEQLHAADSMLNELEDTMASPYLCGDAFTKADVLLSVVLKRLRHIGLFGYLVNDKRRLNLVKYYETIKTRRSFVEVYGVT